MNSGKKSLQSLQNELIILSYLNTQNWFLLLWRWDIVEIKVSIKNDFQLLGELPLLQHTTSLTEHINRPGYLPKIQYDIFNTGVLFTDEPLNMGMVAHIYCLYCRDANTGKSSSSYWDTLDQSETWSE